MNTGSGSFAPAATDALADAFPLTPSQRSLQPTSATGLGSVIARHWEQAIWGELSAKRLARAAEIVARRHPPVRAVLDPGGLQEQRLAAAAPASLVHVTDATSLDETAQRKRLAAERARLCLTETGNLGRAWQLHVLRTGPHTAVVTACFARTFFDRTSIRNLLDDLLAAYQASGHDTPTASLSWDAVAAPATGPSSDSPAVAELLANLPPGPELPLVSAPPSQSKPEHARVTVRLAAGAWAGIKANLSAEVREASPNALITAACTSVLAMWTKQSRFAVQLWLEEDRSPDAAAFETSGQRTRLLLALTDELEPSPFHQRVLEAQRTIEQASQAALAEAVVAADRAQLPAVALSPWFPRHVTIDSGPSRSDQFVFVGASRPGVALEFHAEETPEGSLVVALDHVRELFPAGLIDALSAALERWLQALATSRAVWSLTPREVGTRLFPTVQRESREQYNATDAPIADDLLFSGFLRQLAGAADRAAVVTPTRTLTYADLRGYAGRLAHELRERGVRPNELVAIALDKGWEQVAAAVGITLAGAAYLPVDLELPEERIRYLIEYGEARVVVTSSARARALSLPAGVDAISLDTLRPLEPDAALPETSITPENLAYVIFTSGSTGLPKGVMIDHRGAVNTIFDLNKRFHVWKEDRVLALSRLSFDLSVYDIFGLLAVGGTIVLPDPELARDPAHWAELVRTHRVTMWNTVPALMQLLVDHADDRPEILGDSLRTIWLSGDWIPLPLPERIWRLRPGVQIISMGGATEASIWSILYPITSVEPGWRSIPYGRPMLNQTVHVLHENLAPCPDHVTGELFIGGIGVARGYWRDPVKTEARFISHPATGERLYRTGDLGRFLPDGHIEFLGRADFQVKIRGFRIELGEIESTLTSHGSVHAAVVTARGESDATRQLVGYVVPKENPPSAEELQAFLRHRLPEYMVPSVFVFLERLPLTANGKVDLKSLPAPTGGGAANTRAEPAAAPGNEIEEILVPLWRETLGVTVIGIHDDFFALGGNSLSGTRLIMRLRDAFALPLPVQSLFANPTIHRLAAVIEAQLLADVAAEPAGQ